MWAKEQEPTCPLSQPPPALSVKCQQAREGGGETGKLLTRKMLGRGWCRLRLPDSYSGMCYDVLSPGRGEASLWELCTGTLPEGRGSRSLQVEGERVLGPSGA